MMILYGLLVIVGFLGSDLMDSEFVGRCNIKRKFLVVLEVLRSWFAAMVTMGTESIVTALWKV
jgi:hypothetical protein